MDSAAPPGGRVVSDIPQAAGLAGLASVFALAMIATSVQNGSLGRVVTLEPRPGSGRARLLLLRIGGSRFGRLVRRDRLDALLAAADVGWGKDEVVGVKVLAFFLGLATSIAASAPVLVLPLGFVAWRSPEILLGRRARRRASEASAEVPLFLDLLAVACSAGLAPQLAVRLAAEPLRGSLAVELGVAIGRTDLGRRWRDELGAAADRLGLVDLRRAAAVLGRSEALGSSLAAEMSRLAADVREGRRSRATERARAAPVKMLFPLVFLILPAFLLLTVVPVLLSTVRSIA